MMTKLLGLFILGGSLAVVFLYENSAMAAGAFRIFHWPAMLLTGVGPLGLVLLCSDWDRIRRSVGYLFDLSPSAAMKQHEMDAQLIPRLSHEFYHSGAKAIEAVDTKKCSSAFQKAVERLVIRIPTSDVRSLVERERYLSENYFAQGVNFFGLGVRLSPSVGMLGTILGMVHLLSTLDDPSHIGSHMGLALLTTFYGLFFSLVFWTPLQQRVERLMDIRMRGYDQLLHWLELLEQRKPVQYLTDLADGSAKSMSNPTFQEA